MLVITDPKNMEEVRAFADSRGPKIRKILEDRLDYLDNYAGKEKTRCYLSPDGANNFFFRMERLNETLTDERKAKYQVEFVENFLKSMIPVMQDGVFHASERDSVIGKFDSFLLKIFAVYNSWFSGGLIYYGVGETGVGAPQFSVRLDAREEGWEVHT